MAENIHQIIAQLKKEKEKNETLLKALQEELNEQTEAYQNLPASKLKATIEENENRIFTLKREIAQTLESLSGTKLDLLAHPTQNATALQHPTPSPAPQQMNLFAEAQNAQLRKGVVRAPTRTPEELQKNTLEKTILDQKKKIEDLQEKIKKINFDLQANQTPELISVYQGQIRNQQSLIRELTQTKEEVNHLLKDKQEQEEEARKLKEQAESNVRQATAGSSSPTTRPGVPPPPPPPTPAQLKAAGNKKTSPLNSPAPANQQAVSSTTPGQKPAASNVKAPGGALPAGLAELLAARRQSIAGRREDDDSDSDNDEGEKARIRKQKAMVAAQKQKQAEERQAREARHRILQSIEDDLRPDLSGLETALHTEQHVLSGSQRENHQFLAAIGPLIQGAQQKNREIMEEIRAAQARRVSERQQEVGGGGPAASTMQSERGNSFIRRHVEEARALERRIYGEPITPTFEQVNQEWWSNESNVRDYFHDLQYQLQLKNLQVESSAQSSTIQSEKWDSPIRRYVEEARALEQRIYGEPITPTFEQVNQEWWSDKNNVRDYFQDLQYQLQLQSKNLQVESSAQSSTMQSERESALIREYVEEARALEQEIYGEPRTRTFEEVNQGWWSDESNVSTYLNDLRSELRIKRNVEEAHKLESQIYGHATTPSYGKVSHDWWANQANADGYLKELRHKLPGRGSPR